MPGASTTNEAAAAANSRSGAGRRSAGRPGQVRPHDRRQQRGQEDVPGTGRVDHARRAGRPTSSPLGVAVRRDSEQPAPVVAVGQGQPATGREEARDIARRQVPGEIVAADPDEVGDREEGRGAGWASPRHQVGTLLAQEALPAEATNAASGTTAAQVSSSSDATGTSDHARASRQARGSLGTGRGRPRDGQPWTRPPGVSSLWKTGTLGRARREGARRRPRGAGRARSPWRRPASTPMIAAVRRPSRAVVSAA